MGYDAFGHGGPGGIRTPNLCHLKAAPLPRWATGPVLIGSAARIRTENLRCLRPPPLPCWATAPRNLFRNLSLQLAKPVPSALYGHLGSLRPCFVTRVFQNQKPPGRDRQGACFSVSEEMTYFLHLPLAVGLNSKYRWERRRFFVITGKSVVRCFGDVKKKFKSLWKC